MMPRARSSRLGGNWRANSQGSSHHCTVNAHPALPCPSSHRKPAVRRPPRVRLIDIVRHRQPRESRKAWFWVSSANNPKTLGLLFPRPHKQFLTSWMVRGLIEKQPLV
ncbi:MAG: hypothetical protein OXC82_09975, partial [Rhodobacteraceae bacterium]|nr:hypothetical protein [Paracoccaceae bacterium]